LTGLQSNKPSSRPLFSQLSSIHKVVFSSAFKELPSVLQLRAGRLAKNNIWKSQEPIHIIDF